MDELSFLNKDKKQLRQDIFRIAREETGLENLKPGGVLRGFLEVFTQVIFTLYQGALNSILKQANPLEKSGIWLEMWAAQCGVKRIPPVKAQGRALLKAYALGTAPQGAFLRVPSTNIRFKVSQTTNFHPGDNFLPVQAEKSGTLHNLPEGTELVPQNVIPGLESLELGEHWQAAEGRSAESDEALRERISWLWASISENNPPAKLQRIAQSLPGIREAKVVRTPRGEGTVDLYICAFSGQEDEELRRAVHTAISQAAPVCRDLMVKWPGAVYTDVEIEYSGPYEEEAVEAAARDFILSVPMGGVLEQRHFYEKMEELFPQLGRLEIISPSRDLNASGSNDRVGKILPPGHEEEDGYIFKVRRR